MTKIEGSGSASGSGSGSISTRHGSADPDPDPDPLQNVMDPQHWSKLHEFYRIQVYETGNVMYSRLECTGVRYFLNC
jgi:hypothetical protein